MYVIVEGIDGSGKSSVVSALAEQLGSTGWPKTEVDSDAYSNEPMFVRARRQSVPPGYHPPPFKQRVLVRREPSGSDAGLAARAYFKGRSAGAPYDPLVAAGLMIADRQAALHARYDLICSSDSLLLSDRGFLSTLAYQGTTDSFDTLWRMHGTVALPHVVLYLDCPPPLAFSRAQARGGEHLTLEEIRSVWFNYDRAMRLVPYVVNKVDVEDRPLSEVVESCRAAILGFAASHPEGFSTRMMNGYNR